MAKKKILFICTANVSRSRTGEDLLKDSEEYEVQSAGLIYHPDGGQIVNQELINWADIIVAMNETEKSQDRPPCRHLTQLCRQYDLRNKEIFVFNIPDVYHRGNPELVKLIKTKLSSMIGIVV